MSFSKVHSAQNLILEPHIIDIETDISRGLFSFSIVGLGDKAVDEARDRVVAAIKNSGFSSPKSDNHKIVVSLAPADMRKEGASFDVGVALGYLLSKELVSFEPKGKMFLGELALDGNIRPIAGVLPLVDFAKKKGFKEIFVPMENVGEAAIVPNIKIFGVKNLRELAAHLDPKLREEVGGTEIVPAKHIPYAPALEDFSPDFDDIEGQTTAKRGLEIACAGGHHIAFYGPPGTGKTMLAKACVSVLPTLSFEDAIEATSIHSIAGTLHGDYLSAPPFRAPHHTSSYAALVGGGGSIPRPGEMTLAHKGVLFLDEFPEFDRRVVESLREPLEEKSIAISRANGSARFPADFTLIAAMNPCPCGMRNVKGKRCICTASQLSKYEKKLSGPIVDRIDMWIEVLPVRHEGLLKKRVGQFETKAMREKIVQARRQQMFRFKNHPRHISKNSEMNARDVKDVLEKGSDAEKVLIQSAQVHNFSPRTFHRIVKLARTIADLEGKEKIAPEHIYEAIQYRPKNTFFSS